MTGERMNDGEKHAEYSVRRANRLSLRAKAAYACVVVVGFFALLEVTLALIGVRSPLADEDPYVGFESSIRLFEPRPLDATPADESVEHPATEDSPTSLQTAENKLAFFNPQRFLLNKPADVVRVFCVGGSTTFGRPYDDRTSFAAWMRELLPEADPGRRWEVINAGGISYASYRVATVMEELSNYSPDLFVIYTGHNEFLEERTYGNVRDASSRWRQLAMPLWRSRTGGLMRRWLGRSSPDDSGRARLPAEVDTLLDHSAGPDIYHRDDALRRNVVEHFRWNLSRMVRIARRAGAKVIFVTPAANLKDFSPFKSEHRHGLTPGQEKEWEQLVSAARSLQTQGRFEQALERLETAERIDDQVADLHYQMAALQFAQKRYGLARRSFERAVDRDVCPLRATSEIQQSLEQVAIEQRVPLVDFESIVSHACLQTLGHDIPGNEYFLDHVHPTVEGHRLLALAVINAMSQCGWLPLSSSPDSEAIAAAGRRIMSRVDPELQARALTNLAQVLSWAGKQDEAVPIAKQAVQLRERADLAVDPESLFYAAVGDATKGNDEDAIDALRQVIELQPKHFDARWRLGTLLYDRERYEQSLAEFRIAVALNPQHAYSYQMLGAALLRLERYSDALAAWQRAIELDPNDSGLRENISLVREKIRGG